MLNEKRIVTVSKFLSKHLRHSPHSIGITLDPAGWVSVDDLLQACQRNHVAISIEDLEQVVTQNDKQRFAFDETRQRIRASQGHTIGVELGLPPITPPETLYHGTGERSVSLILAEGLRKMRRDHVHLSGDVETAIRVGSRHGRPVVLAVDAGAMASAGHKFFRSENGVYLVDFVPARYIQAS